MVNKWLKGQSLSTKRLVVESLSDIEASIFKALLTYHFLIIIIIMVIKDQRLNTLIEQS